MFPRNAAQLTNGPSPRASEHFLSSAQLVRFRNILIQKFRPQPASNHIDAKSFDLKARIFILIHKNKGRGSARTGGLLCQPVVH